MNEIVKYDETHLEVMVVPTWEQAQEAMNSLDVIGRNANWWVGDFLNYVEECFGNDKWTQLIPDTGWSHKTLMNIKWVSANVRPNGRYAELSWSHHEAVSGLDPTAQDFYLKQAFDNGWTVSQLRKELRGVKPEKPEKVYKLPCPHCGSEFEITESELKGGQ